MSKLGYIPLILFVLLSCHLTKNKKNDSTNNTFQKLLTEHSLTLTTPVNFKEVPVNENSNIKYQYALKHNSLDFEIRFLISDINTELKLPDNIRSLSLFRSLLLNASGMVLPDIPKINVLDEGIVRQAYKADWGANSVFYSKSSFSKEYSINSIMALRKNENAEVYIFFLFNDKEKSSHIISQVASCLKFNE